MRPWHDDAAIEERMTSLGYVARSDEPPEAPVPLPPGATWSAHAWTGPEGTVELHRVRYTSPRFAEVHVADVTRRGAEGGGGQTAIGEAALMLEELVLHARALDAAAAQRLLSRLNPEQQPQPVGEGPGDSEEPPTDD